MEIAEGIVKGCSWKVYLGNCLDIMKNMVGKNELVDCIVTSPPYFNRRSYGAKPKIDGNIAKWLYANPGKPIEGEIGNSNDKDKYIKDIGEVLKLCYRVLKDDKLIFINIGNTHEKLELLDFSSNFIEGAKKAGFIHWDTIIWIKGNPMPPGKHKNYYLAQGWEYILVFRKGKKVNIDSTNIKIKTHFKCKNCEEENYLNSEITPNYVYSYIGCYGRQYTRIVSHPAIFPIDIPKFCLSIATKQEDTILDPFVGSGATLIAGLEQGLNVIGCELEPEIYQELTEGMRALS
ncbi:DNA-methyltransferase [Clostridium tetani]|uniref:DNA-methyltransferase n=1 Tax=Clostridium tetani TaxID=1513 RepID=UPI00100A563C|nr:site-specific DNA-methyltransferase [Clostridium tetani]RXI40137.1 hypothetical protein DP129_05335 [Clostridium tetani]RXM59315.1 hypothetical protein DP133_00290 [Clostridium tetani]RXM74070.1 hypothetical protein DP154_13235 [Clostridium tetani]RYU97972.1 hypothetical protein DP144_12995 [Clostridium tetani]